MPRSTLSQLDFQRFFVTAPGLYVILRPDLTIAAANDAFCAATMTVRDEILGRVIFDVFPANPENPGASAAGKVRASLMRVLELRRPDAIEVQRHDIRRPGDGFEERYWTGLNTPILDADGSVAWIILRAEDMTALVKFQAKGAALDKLAQEQQGVIEQLRAANRDLAKQIKKNATLQQERERAQELLRRNVRLLEAAQEVAKLGSWVSAPGQEDGLEWSREVYRIFGLTEAEFDHRVETFLDMVHPEDREMVIEASRDAVENGRPYSIDHRIVRRDGTVRWVHERATVFRDAQETPAQMIGVVQDITEKRLVEQQLAQAQKMEAIGALTGGMAHDFNNLLGVIIGNLDTLCDRRRDDAVVMELGGQALDAAMRGADLTRRLLAFARRQPLQPRRIAVNELIAGITKLLGRTLGENVEIVVDAAPHLWSVVADPAQLEASLANLATNARDAMQPKGGRLRIATRNRHFDEDYVAEHPGVIPGEYVMIEVSDNGCGMPPEVKDRIFEPFFTTKEPGKGSGLGLSMVFGFLRQSGGHVYVYSEVGVGTTFRLYLPRARKDGETESRPAAATVAGGRGETVLAVEDNAAMRRVVVRQLKELGYRVLEAENAAAALALLERERVDLLFTDVIMPGGTTGFDLARTAMSRWPRLRVVLTSGFPDAKLDGAAAAPADLRLLSKPYRKDDLARTLRDTLDA